MLNRIIILKNVLSFFLARIEVINKPIPSPKIIDPTNIRADSARKKKPIPRPARTPPPIAQLLLSSLLFIVMININFVKLHLK